MKDENRVRYRLVESNNGTAHNWLFVPGGPGADLHMPWVEKPHEVKNSFYKLLGRVV